MTEIARLGRLGRDKIACILVAGSVRNVVLTVYRRFNANFPRRYGEVNTPPGLLESLLPGPVTVMFTRKDTLNKALNPTAACVGVRVPDSDFSMLVVHVC